MAKNAQSVEFEELIVAFDRLEDSRSHINRRHPLTAVVVISLMGVLAGADGPTGIRKWAETKKQELIELLNLELRAAVAGRDPPRSVCTAP